MDVLRGVGSRVSRVDVGPKDVRSVLGRAARFSEIAHDFASKVEGAHCSEKIPLHAMPWTWPRGVAPSDSTQEVKGKVEG